MDSTTIAMLSAEAMGEAKAIECSDGWVLTDLVAVYKGKHWTAVYTRRGNNIRIISVRRSRAKEITYYEN